MGLPEDVHSYAILPVGFPLGKFGPVRRAPLAATDVFGHGEFITPDGDLRTLPCYLPDADSRFAGIDGFYAARLVKN